MTKGHSRTKNKIPEPKPKGTRGPKFRDFDPEVVFVLASDGMTQSEIAYALGATPDTWFRRIREQLDQHGFSEISEAYNQGKGQHAKEVIGGLAELARKKNLGALIFLAKAHHGRRENISLNVAGDPDAPLSLSVQALSPEQRRARIDELERKRADGDYIAALPAPEE